MTCGPERDGAVIAVMRQVVDAARIDMGTRSVKVGIIRFTARAGCHGLFVARMFRGNGSRGCSRTPEVWAVCADFAAGGADGGRSARDAGASDGTRIIRCAKDHPSEPPAEVRRGRCSARPSGFGRGHRPGHAVRVPQARRGPKPPASARPAHGGRFAPAGTGAGLRCACGNGPGGAVVAARAGKRGAFPDPPGPAGPC